jgi:membrane protein YqaA with SNARE-associated domain
VLVWGLLQGSVVPGPADVVYAPLAAASPRRAVRLALLAALGSTVGGVIAYSIGAALAGDGIEGPLARALATVGITVEAIAPWRARIAQWGWALVLLATVSPLSTKAVCIAAGAVSVSPLPFVAALAFGRTVRTLTIAVVAARVASALQRSERFRWWQKGKQSA